MPRGQRVTLPARKAKLDLLITSARYDAESGQLLFAKGFETVGQIWSDILLIGRVELAARIKDGERIVTGTKEDPLADFEPRQEIRLVEVAGGHVIVAGETAEDRDDLDVPLF